MTALGLIVGLRAVARELTDHLVNVALIARRATVLRGEACPEAEAILDDARALLARCEALRAKENAR